MLSFVIRSAPAEISLTEDNVPPLVTAANWVNSPPGAVWVVDVRTQLVLVAPEPTLGVRVTLLGITAMIDGLPIASDLPLRGVQFAPEQASVCVLPNS
jgi:hypothetical protein